MVPGRMASLRQRDSVRTVEGVWKEEREKREERRKKELTHDRHLSGPYVVFTGNFQIVVAGCE